MDRSFLSLTSVIEASRRFVCIRTLTYENAEERDFQRSLYIGRSGDVENTTFCILSPDGKKPITRAGRGIRQIFQSPDQMQWWMAEAA
ncbi:MAG: thioredoxin family protein, partial [Actinomycetota bacterium]